MPSCPSPLRSRCPRLFNTCDRLVLSNQSETFFGIPVYVRARSKDRNFLRLGSGQTREVLRVEVLKAPEASDPEAVKWATGPGRGKHHD